VIVIVVVAASVVVVVEVVVIAVVVVVVVVLVVVVNSGSATYILCDCEALANLRFRHLGQFFMDPSDYYGAPINKVLHFVRSVGLIKG
jgi:hypothetical protein